MKQRWSTSSALLLVFPFASALAALAEPPTPQGPCGPAEDLYLQEDALSLFGALPFQDVAPLGDGSLADSEVAEDFTTPAPLLSSGAPNGERWVVEAVRGTLVTTNGNLPAGIAVSIRIDDTTVENERPGQVVCAPGVVVPEAIGSLEDGRQAVRLALPTACSLCAGTRYWVTLQAQDAGQASPVFAWAQRTPAAGSPAQWRRGGSAALWVWPQTQGVGDGFSADVGLALEGRRHAVPYAKGDLNGDLCPDLLFQRSQTGELKAWLMQGVTRAGAELPVEFGENDDLPVRALDYIDGDAIPDLVVQADGAAPRFILGSDVPGSSLPDFSDPPVAPPPMPEDPHWVAVSGRFANGITTDLVCQGARPGSLEIWYGPVIQNVVKNKPNTPLPVAEGLLAMGAADFDGDGETDFAFRDPVTGTVSVVGLDADLGLVGSGTGPAVPDRPLDASYVLAGVADLGLGPDPVPGDGIAPTCGTPDLLFQSVLNGRVVAWHLDFARRRSAGVSVGPSTATLPGPGWVLVAPR